MRQRLARSPFHKDGYLVSRHLIVLQPMTRAYFLENMYESWRFNI
jgi:hypothetical protein